MLLMELEGKPDLEEAFSRVEAWFNHEKLDRPLVRFSEHNAEFASSRPLDGYNWPDLKARWFDAEFQVDQFMESIRGRTFHGETFPMFFPNLGPNVYAAFHGLELEFGGVTSWIRHVVRDWDDLNRLKFSWEKRILSRLGESDSGGAGEMLRQVLGGVHGLARQS